jgi:hypothetical protein
MQQFGLLTAITILYSLITSIYVLPSMLVLWARVAQGDDPYLKVRNVFMERHRKFEKDLIKLYKDIKQAGKNVAQALEAGLITTAEATHLKNAWKYLEKRMQMEREKMKGMKLPKVKLPDVKASAVEAGKKIGTAVDKTGKKIGDATVETGKKIGTAVDKTGKKIGDATEKMADKVKKKPKEE